MPGGEARRLCDSCHKQVHDLASLTASEAERLLASALPGSLCVRIEHEEDGAIRFKPGGAGVRAMMTLAVGASLLMTSCAPGEDKRAPAAPASAQPSASAARRGDEAVIVAEPPPASALPAVDASAKSVAAPPSSGRANTRTTIGCVCAPNDSLCSCL